MFYSATRYNRQGVSESHPGLLGSRKQASGVESHLIFEDSEINISGIRNIETELYQRHKDCLSADGGSQGCTKQVPDPLAAFSKLSTTLGASHPRNFLSETNYKENSGVEDCVVISLI